MRAQVARLTKLATVLLDLSRMDAGRLAVADESFDLAVVGEMLATEFGPRVAAARPRCSSSTTGGPAYARARRGAGAPDRADPGRERDRAHAARDGRSGSSAAARGRPGDA